MLARTLYLFALVAIVAITDAAAQPAFTYDDYPNIGDSDTTLSQAQVIRKADVEAAGNGRTWDFSSFVYIPTFRQVILYRKPEAQSSKPFTDATIEEYGNGINGETVWIWTMSNDTLYRIHQGDNVNGATYFPHYPDIVFPMTFGQVYEHSQAQNIGDPPISPAWIRSSRVEYDGYGKLKLPWGTYTDVYRLHWIELDSAIGVTLNNKYNSYFWYRKGGGIPLFRALFNGDLDAENAIYSTWASRAPAGTASVDRALSSIARAYPNPVTDQLRFDREVESIRVFGQLGNCVIESMLPTRSISLATLPASVYVIEYIVDGERYHQRLVKQ